MTRAASSSAARRSFSRRSATEPEQQKERDQQGKNGERNENGPLEVIHPTTNRASMRWVPHPDHQNEAIGGTSDSTGNIEGSRPGKLQTCDRERSCTADQLTIAVHFVSLVHRTGRHRQLRCVRPGGNLQAPREPLHPIRRRLRPRQRDPAPATVIEVRLRVAGVVVSAHSPLAAELDVKRVLSEQSRCCNKEQEHSP